MQVYKPLFEVFEKEYYKDEGPYDSESNPIIGDTEFAHNGKVFYPVESTILEGSFTVSSSYGLDWYEAVRFNGTKLNSILNTWANMNDDVSAPIYNPFIPCMGNPDLLYAYIKQFGKTKAQLTLDMGAGGWVPSTDSFKARIIFAAIEQ